MVLDIAIQPTGHKRQRASTYGPDIEERLCKVRCTEAEVMGFAAISNFVQEYHLKDFRAQGSHCVILGAKRNVDMAPGPNAGGALRHAAALQSANIGAS